MNDTVIRIDHLIKYYGKTIGVDDISFAVEKGEVFGFLGPNGAGKTTTIRLMLGLLGGNTGEIHLFGETDRTKITRLRDRIGYLSGEFRAYDFMKAGTFLDYISRYRQSPPKLQDQLLSRFRIDNAHLNQRIKNLSHGNRQKIGLVMAMQHDPDLLILDEPTIGLDPFMQEAFYETVMEFRDRGKTVFLSSHILSEVDKICRRVAIIREGKIAAVETLEELKKKQRRRMIIQFKDGTPAVPLAGADLLEQRGNRITYQIRDSWQPVLQALASLPVENITIPEAELEDIFFAYYQDGRNA
jgi:ABC-2 type transport system ATP-binding protein